MDYIKQIRQPITTELDDFICLFNSSLSHANGLLSQALEHIKNRGGKRMRPMLILLIAKNFGDVTDVTLRSAIGLELLHTASLVHDDVVDESSQRRGQASVNATYDNKVAVLVGDYILSTALLNVAMTGSKDIVAYLARLGQTLSNGEILQLTNISNEVISEQVYYDVIRQKTAALFEACAGIGTLSVGASPEVVEEAKRFGSNIGMIFQIRDDIFDYYESPEIGKPTGNDMAEGKLTLPVIYAVNNTDDPAIRQLAYKVKDQTVTPEEIATLVAYAKEHGGIDYAVSRMREFYAQAQEFIDKYVEKQDVRQALQAYLDFMIERNL